MEVEELHALPGTNSFAIGFRAPAPAVSCRTPARADIVDIIDRELKPFLIEARLFGLLVLKSTGSEYDVVESFLSKNLRQQLWEGCEARCVNIDSTRGFTLRRAV